MPSLTFPNVPSPKDLPIHEIQLGEVRQSLTYYIVSDSPAFRIRLGLHSTPTFRIFKCLIQLLQLLCNVFLWCDLLTAASALGCFLQYLM